MDIENTDQTFRHRARGTRVAASRSCCALRQRADRRCRRMHRACRHARAGERIHDRIAGVPPSATVSTNMVAALNRAGRHAATAAASRDCDNPQLLQRDAEELRHAVDQPRSDGVRAAERLHRHRHRHGARRRAVQHRAVGRHSLYEQRGRPAGALDLPTTITTRRPKPTAST